MFVATLISPHDRRHLEAALVESLRNAWGGGEAVWLAPDEAAEFPLRDRPGNLAELGDSLRGMGLDLALQPMEGRRKRLLIADMDSTMIGQECIDELAAMAGVGEKVAAITARAMNGELDFEGALTERVALLKGLDAGVIDRVWAERITLTPGGKALVATMKAQGARAALVSGGFTAFTRRVAHALGFDEHRANELPISEGRITGAAPDPILGREAKVTALREITAAMGITPAEAMAVGDGANDLGMIELAGAGVALHAKPSVAAQAPIRIDHADLRALLWLQGYTSEQVIEG